MYTPTYSFTTKRASEINKDNSQAAIEAVAMKAAFESQGNTKHSREMTHVFAQSVINDDMFQLVVDEYRKL